MNTREKIKLKRRVSLPARRHRERVADDAERRERQKRVIVTAAKQATRQLDVDKVEG